MPRMILAGLLAVGLFVILTTLVITLAPYIAGGLLILGIYLYLTKQDPSSP